MKKIIKNPFFWGLIIGILFIHLYREYSILRKKAPDPLVIVPDWQLLDQNNNIFKKTDTKGKIVIADYFFTRCPTICPKLNETMKEIYNILNDKQDKTVFLSFSVDPEHDTSNVLKEFSEKYAMNKPNWYFLTGSKKDIFDTVSNKMKLHVGERDKEDFYDIPHLAHLVLFDKNGNIRGLFKTEKKDINSLIRAANYLMENE